MFNTKPVQPVRLDTESKFRFRCHKGVPCFTLCCSNIDIMLTPYDVLRMKQRLGISSEEFIANYVNVRVDDKSSHPYAYLRLSDNEDRTCQFLKSANDGCGIYEDRPVSCRYYPVGQATMKKASEEEGGEPIHEEFYFFVKEEHCQGFKEQDQWTVQSWRDDQGSEHYDAMNREWKELLMRRDVPGQAKLDQKKQTMFFIASYDLDKFRRFVFDSRFLDAFEVDAEEIERMRTDDVALMKFGFRYIKFLMMMEDSLKPREGVLDEAKRKADERRAAKEAEPK